MTRALVVQVAIVVGLAGMAQAEEWTKRFTISGKPELRVDANDGAVVVRAWDHKEISARVFTTGWRIPSDVQVVDRQMGDRVEIELKMPHHGFTFGITNRSIRIELDVPRDLRAELRTGDGSITVDGLRGDIRLHTGDGRIEANGIDGNLDAQTGDGRVHVRGRFDMLTLRTGDGSIDAEVGSGSKMASEWNVHTGDGHVTLRLPSDFSAELNVHTGDGHIRSDLPVTVSGIRGEHELRGRLNAGGPVLTVRTNDGSITLERM